MDNEMLSSNGCSEPGMNPDDWKKILKIVIAVLTALAGCLGVSTVAANGFFNIG